MKHQPPPDFETGDVLEDVFFGLPKTLQEAERRFAKFRSTDPFPDIAPALLNTADLIEYVTATGMVFPFYPQEAYLKPASYALRLMGPYVYWDGRGDGRDDRRAGVLGLNDVFTLESDSIAFVTLEPELRLPDYIAMRFDLRIDNVYRGLLLGTGPLVDPGFVGRLSIPLHNLTTNSYDFRGGDSLIWAEFTKLSPNKRWSPGGAETRKWEETDLFQDFDKEVPEDAQAYLDLASPGRPVQSSIPVAISESKRAAEDARVVVRGAHYATLVTLIALVLTLVPLGWVLVKLNGQLTEDRLEQAQLEQKVDSLAGEIAALRDSIAALR